MSDVWPRFAPLLRDVERPSRYLNREWGAVRDDSAGFRVALLYPDTYEVGMANQAIQILYARINGLDDVCAERAYVPWADCAAALRGRGVPLHTLETATPLRDCDIVGITLPYELSYTNVLEALDLAGIPLYARDRGESDPLVIGGGPCAFNPEPVAPFFDAILIGDGEEAAIELVEEARRARDAGTDRRTRVAALAGIQGVYVPLLYEPDSGGRISAVPTAPERVRKRVLHDLASVPAPTCPVVPYMDVVHDRATLEVLRGCARGCRFCQAGMVYRPVRERSADDIVRDALATVRCTGYEELSLTSLSTADHSQLEDVLRRLSLRLAGTGVALSVPSLRVDAFSLSLARLLGGGRKTGLTFAPEAGTQRLRDVINKNVTDEDLLGTVRQAFGAGWRRVKLYFMLGLPTETDADVAGIGQLVGRVVDTARSVTPPGERGAIRIAVSVSTFVPKAHTPFQWDGQLPPSEVRRRQELLRSGMPRKGVELSWHDADVSFLEAVLARGGRELAPALESAWRAGAVFAAWTERFSPAPWRAAFESAGVDAEAIATRSLEPGTTMPWAHIDTGIAESFLAAERERAGGAQTTEDCTFGACSGCGVCEPGGPANRIAEGARHG